MKYGHHPALRDAGMRGLFLGDEHLAVALDWIRELAGRFEDNGYCFDPGVLDLLEAQNSAFFKWLRNVSVDLSRCC